MSVINDNSQNNTGEINANKISLDIKDSIQHNIKEIKSKNNINEISVPIDENFQQFQKNENNSGYCNIIKRCINYLDNLDKTISSPLHKYSPGYKIECIFYCFARLFNVDTVIIYLVSALIYSFLKYKNGYMALIPICHVIVGVIVTLITKASIRRPRPIIKVRKHFKLKENTHSMPSGDSLQAGIFATMIILYLKTNFRFLSILLIPGVMLGRIFYNLHYWFDCIIGAILGIFVSFETYNVINIYIQNKIVKL